MTIRDQVHFLEADPSTLEFPFVRQVRDVIFQYIFIFQYPLMIGSARDSLLEHMHVIKNARLDFEMGHEESKNEMEAAVEAVIQVSRVDAGQKMVECGENQHRKNYVRDLR